MRWVRVPDSSPHHGTGIRSVSGRPDPAQVIRATVVVHSRCRDPELRREVDRHIRLDPLDRPRLTPLQFVHRYGPLRSDMGMVITHARSHGLRVVGISSARHSVILSGTLERFARAFRVGFANYALGDAHFIGHSTPMFVPSPLSEAVAAVLGFDDRPLARPETATAGRGRGVGPDTVARAYGFAPVRDGARRQSIAIMLPYGGYRESDLVGFFTGLGRRVPVIRDLNIDGHSNQPAPPDALRQFGDQLRGKSGLLDVLAGDRARGPGSSRWNVLWSMEAALDIELAGALAPASDLLLCFMPDNPRGQFEGFARTMTHPTRPTVISCSWSAHEHDVPPSLLGVLNRLFMFAALRNITICCSSGDDGAAPGERRRVHFPASSPYVLACGGSTFPDPAGVRRESVWNEQVGPKHMSSSGGFSRVFPRPWWQRDRVKRRGGGRSGRAVPDVAAKADFRHGYRIVAGGRTVALGGTSAATPTWAALVARLNDAVRSPVGCISPQLYSERARGALYAVTSGGNGTYRAARGWNPCTGLGTPIGAALLDLVGRSARVPAPRRSAGRRSGAG